MNEIGLCVRQDVNFAEGDFADGGELLDQPSGIVPALLDNSDQAQRIEGAERMSRSLGFDLVLSCDDVGIRGGRLDDLVIGHTFDLMTWGKISGYNPLKKGATSLKSVSTLLRCGGVDRVRISC